MKCRIAIHKTANGFVASDPQMNMVTYADMHVFNKFNDLVEFLRKELDGKLEKKQ